MRGLFKNKPLIIMLVAVLLLGVLAFITSADRLLRQRLQTV